MVAEKVLANYYNLDSIRVQHASIHLKIGKVSYKIYSEPMLEPELFSALQYRVYHTLIVHLLRLRAVSGLIIDRLLIFQKHSNQILRLF